MAFQGSYVSARDRALYKQRDEEARVNTLQKMVNAASLQSVINTRDDAVEGKRRQIELEEIAREEHMEAITRTAFLEAQRRKRQQEHEEALAHELERRKREEESKKREIQRICEEDPGLRDLQAKLKTAYIAKQRYGQIEERKVLTEVEIHQQRALDAAMEQERIRAIEAEKIVEQQRKQQSLAAKAQIQKQLEEKEVREYLAAEQEGARERAMIDSILSKIRAEDDAEAAQKAKQREETARVIEEFKVQRQRAVEAQRMSEREAEHQIAEYLASQAHRQEEVRRAKAEDAAVREAQYRAIVAEQEAIRKKQEEEEALRWLLVEEEAEKRRLESDAKRKAEIEKSRREMLVANEEQRRIRERTAAEAAAKEAALIQQFLAKCAEDEKRSAIERKIKTEARARYMQEVKMQRDERVALYQAQKLMEIQVLEEAKRKDEFRKRVIQEARRKLLQEHAANLAGFLPRGVILSNSDLDIIKAFDRNKDGILEPEELELAQAAFAAYDPEKHAPAAASSSLASASEPAHSAAGGFGAAGRPPRAAGGGGVALGGAQNNNNSAFGGESAYPSTAGGYGSVRASRPGTSVAFADPVSSEGGGMPLSTGAFPQSKGVFGGQREASAGGLGFGDFGGGGNNNNNNRGAGGNAPGARAHGSRASSISSSGTAGLLPGGGEFYGSRKY